MFDADLPAHRRAGPARRRRTSRSTSSTRRRRTRAGATRARSRSSCSSSSVDRRLLGHPPDRARPGGDARGAHRRRRGRRRGSGGAGRGSDRGGGEGLMATVATHRAAGATPTSARHEGTGSSRSRGSPRSSVIGAACSPSRSTGRSRCRSSRRPEWNPPGKVYWWPENPTLDNYKNILGLRTQASERRSRRRAHAPRSRPLKNSLIAAIGGTVLALVVGIFTAYGIARFRAGGQTAAVPDPAVTHVPADRDHDPAAVHVGRGRALEHARGV